MTFTITSTDILNGQFHTRTETHTHTHTYIHTGYTYYTDSLYLYSEITAMLTFTIFYFPRGLDSLSQ